MATPNKKVRIEIYKPVNGNDDLRLTGRRHIRPVERQRMRPWLIDHLDKNDIPGLVWKNRKEKQFRISWKHAANQGFSMEKDTNLFERWAIHTGRHCDSDHKRWKANFRCALNSLPDVMEMKNAGIKKGSNAFKVYRFLDDKDPKLLTCKSAARKKKEAAQTTAATAGSDTEEDEDTKQDNSERLDHNYADYIVGSEAGVSMLPSLPLLDEFKQPTGVDLLIQADSKERVRTQVVTTQIDTNPVPTMLFASLINKPGMSMLKHSDISQSGSIVTQPRQVSPVPSASVTDSGRMLLQSISLPMLHQLAEASKRVLDVRKGLKQPSTSTQTYVYLCKWCEKVFADKGKLFRHFLHAHQVELGIKLEAGGDGEATADETTHQDQEQLQQEIATLEKQVFGIARQNIQGKDTETVIEDGEVLDLTPSNELSNKAAYVDDQALDLTIKKEESIHTKQDEALDLTTKGSYQKKGKWVQKPPIKRRRQGLPEIDYSVKFGNYGIAGRPRTKRQMSLHDRKKEEANNMKKAAQDEEAMEISRQRSHEDFLHAEILMSLKCGKSVGSRPSSGDGSLTEGMSGKGAELSGSQKRKHPRSKGKSKAKCQTIPRKKVKVTEKVKMPTLKPWPTLKPFRESMDEVLPYEEKVRKYLTNLDMVIDDVARNRDPGNNQNDNNLAGEFTSETTADNEKLNFCNSMNLIRLDQLSDEPCGFNQDESSDSGNTERVILGKRKPIMKKALRKADKSAKPKVDESFLMLLKLVEESVKTIPYSCCVCGEGLSTDTEIIRHLRSHIGVSFFKCGFCGRTFADDVSFDRHVESHNVAPAVKLCEVCDILMSVEDYAFHDLTIEHMQKAFTRNAEKGDLKPEIEENVADSAVDKVKGKNDCPPSCVGVAKEAQQDVVQLNIKEENSNDINIVKSTDIADTATDIYISSESLNNVNESDAQVLMMKEMVTDNHNTCDEAMPGGSETGVGMIATSSVDIPLQQTSKPEVETCHEIRGDNNSQIEPVEQMNTDTIIKKLEQSLFLPTLVNDEKTDTVTDTNVNTKKASGLSVADCFFGTNVTEDCHICGQSVSKLDFQEHKQEHYSLDYCYICHSPQFNLQEHHSRSHRNIRAFICNMCDRPFYSRSHLTEHVVVHLRPRPDMTKHISRDQVQEFLKWSDGSEVSAKHVPFPQEPPECFADTLEHAKNVFRKGKTKPNKVKKTSKKKKKSIDPVEAEMSTGMLVTESQSLITSTKSPESSPKSEDRFPSNLFMDKKTGTLMTLQVLPGTSKSSVVLLQPQSNTWKMGSAVPSIEDLSKMIWVPVLPFNGQQTSTMSSETSMSAISVTSPMLATTATVKANSMCADNTLGLSGSTAISSVTGLQLASETMTENDSISSQLIKHGSATGSNMEASTTTVWTGSLPSSNKAVSQTGSQLTSTLGPSSLPASTMNLVSALTTQTVTGSSVGFQSATPISSPASTMLNSAQLLLQSIQKYFQAPQAIPPANNPSPILQSTTPIPPSASTMLTSAPLLLQSIQKYLQDTGMTLTTPQARIPTTSANVSSSYASLSLPFSSLLAQAANVIGSTSTCLTLSTSATSTMSSTTGSTSTVPIPDSIAKLQPSLTQVRPTTFANSSETALPKLSVPVQLPPPAQQSGLPVVVTMSLPHQTYQTVSHLLNQPVRLPIQQRLATEQIPQRLTAFTTVVPRTESPASVGSFSQSTSVVPTPIMLPQSVSFSPTIVTSTAALPKMVSVTQANVTLNPGMPQPSSVLPTSVTLKTGLPPSLDANQSQRQDIQSQSMPLQNISLPVTPECAVKLQQFLTSPTMESFSKIPNWAQLLAMNKVALSSDVLTTAVSGSVSSLTTSQTGNSNSQQRSETLVTVTNAAQKNVTSNVKHGDIAMKATAIGDSTTRNTTSVNMGTTGNSMTLGNFVVMSAANWGTHMYQASTRVIPVTCGNSNSSAAGMAKIPIAPTQMTAVQIPICTSKALSGTTETPTLVPAQMTLNSIKQVPIVTAQRQAQIPMPVGAQKGPIGTMMTPQSVGSTSLAFASGTPGLQPYTNTVASNGAHTLQDLRLVAVPQQPASVGNLLIPKIEPGTTNLLIPQTRANIQTNVPAVGNATYTRQSLMSGGMVSQDGAVTKLVAAPASSNAEQKPLVEAHSNIQQSTVTALLSKLMKSQPVSVSQPSESTPSDSLSVPGQFVLTNMPSNATNGVPVLIPTLNLTFKLATPGTSTSTEAALSTPSLTTNTSTVTSSATVAMVKSSTVKGIESKGCKSIIYCKTCRKYFPSGEADSHNCVFPKTFRCPYCKLYVHINTLERHMEMHEKPFVCLKCKAQVTVEKEMIQHVLNHGPSDEEKKHCMRFCRRCNKELGKSLENYFKHFQYAHLEKICRVCLKVCCTQNTPEDEFTAHIRTHYSQCSSESIENICQKCMKIFPSKAFHDQHDCGPVFLAHLSDTCEFTCLTCFQHYVSKDLLDQHLCVQTRKAIKSGDLSKTDEIGTHEQHNLTSMSSSCGIPPSNSRKQELMNSSKGHSSMRYKNEIGILTIDKINRKHAGGSQNSGRKRFCCCVCQFRFNSQYQLKIHKLVSHSLRRSGHLKLKDEQNRKRVQALYRKRVQALYRKRVQALSCACKSGSNDLLRMQLQQDGKPSANVSTVKQMTVDLNTVMGNRVSRELASQAEVPGEIVAGIGTIDSQLLRPTGGDHSIPAREIEAARSESAIQSVTDSHGVNLFPDSDDVLLVSEEEKMIHPSCDVGPCVVGSTTGQMVVISEASLSAAILQTETLSSEQQAFSSDSNKCGFLGEYAARVSEGIVTTSNRDVGAGNDTIPSAVEARLLPIAHQLKPKRKKVKKVKSGPQFVTLKGRVQERLREAIKPHTLVMNKPMLKKNLPSEKEKTDSDLNIKQCRVCDQDLSSMNEREVKDHMKEHRDPVACSVCSGTFDKVSTLKEHLLQKHGSKLYTCVDCGTAHLGRLQLDSHRYKIHGLVNRAQLPSKHREHLEQREKLKKKKIYGCRICKKSFFKLMKLTKHVWEHDQLGDNSIAMETKTAQTEEVEVSGQRSRSQSGESVADGVEKQAGEIIGDGNFMCALCKIAFMESTDLFQHAKVHLEVHEISGKIVNRNRYAQSVTGDPNKMPASLSGETRGPDDTADVSDAREMTDVCVCDICQKCITVEDGSDLSTSVLNHKCY